MTDQWWIVTLREDGDDEDSLIIVHEADEAKAVALAKRLFAEDNNHEERSGECRSCGECPCAESCGACDYPEPPTIHVNHVVCCGATQPKHIRTAP